MALGLDVKGQVLLRLKFKFSDRQRGKKDWVRPTQFQSEITDSLGFGFTLRLTNSFAMKVT